MYTCGITPYDATHLGHAATYLTYDVLQRRLRDRGHETRCVRNITDVDDDLLRKARSSACTTSTWRPGRSPASSRHGSAGRLLPVERTAGDVGHRRHPRVHRHGARPGPRLRGRRRVYFDVAKLAVASVRSATTRTTEMLASPPSGAATSTTRTSADPLDFVLWHPSAARRAQRGTSLWGPAGPAGTSSARRWRCASWAPRSTCTAAAAT
jgi:L-cysteine:1D-myo-inositol 2-amino-2-deoxy-alpha-D-glucopyranoside ligase